MAPDQRRFGRRLWLAIAVASITGSAALAQRPETVKLLPESTVAYVRIENAPQLIEQLNETTLGRVLRDPEMKPFVDELIGAGSNALRDNPNVLGATLEELRQVFAGEVCLALAAPEDGKPALVALVEVGEQPELARALVQRWQTSLEERGDLGFKETWEGTEVTLIARPSDIAQPGEEMRDTVFFEKDGAFVVVTDSELGRRMLSNWNGDDTDTLADNSRFTAIMSRCAGKGEDQAQLTYFVDPVRLVGSVAGDNQGLQMGLFVLEPLGLTGVRGIGGSLVFNNELFESLHHTHLLITPPRSGLLEMLALGTGDVTPEVWAPHDTAEYVTLHWDAQRTHEAFVPLYDMFKGAGAWEDGVLKPLNQQLGVDFARQLLPALSGRFTRLTWMPPDSPTVGTTLIGVRLNDPDAFQSTFETAVRRSSAKFSRISNPRGAYFLAAPPRTANAAGPPRRLCAALVGDYLLIADDESLMKHVLLVKSGDVPALRDELDFKLTASRALREAGGSQPGMLYFERPEIGFRASYELLRSDQARDSLAKIADFNPMFGALYDALEKHPLPPFEHLAKYFAFSGGLLVDQTNGIHSVQFTFRRN